MEHGVLRGEVLGLEVARVVEGRLEIGVGRHDRAARPDAGPRTTDPADRALGRGGGRGDRLRRRPGRPIHPANTLARSRWLRSVVCARPELAGAAGLEPGGASLAVRRPHRQRRRSRPSGPASTGSPLVVVCSTGVDLDLVPTAADCRRLYDPTPIW